MYEWIGYLVCTALFISKVQVIVAFSFSIPRVVFHTSLYHICSDCLLRMPMQGSEQFRIPQIFLLDASLDIFQPLTLLILQSCLHKYSNTSLCTQIQLEFQNLLVLHSIKHPLFHLPRFKLKFRRTSNLTSKPPDAPCSTSPSQFANQTSMFNPSNQMHDSVHRGSNQAYLN